MRRFVVLDESGKLKDEGVQLAGGEVHVIRSRFSMTYDNLTELQETMMPPGWQLRFLDFHTADEAYNLVDQTDAPPPR